MLVGGEQTAVVSLFSDRPAVRTVPDFVGLNYDQATPLERTAGVHIADPDPDAPPISNFWWEHKALIVTRQSPAPGTRIDTRESVTVRLGPPEVPVGAVTRRIEPPALFAHADAPHDESGERR